MAETDGVWQRLMGCGYFCVQAKELKRFKENLKEEEKTAVKRVEQSSSKADKKNAVSQIKVQLQEKRTEKVRARRKKGQVVGVETHVSFMNLNVLWY